MTPKQIESYKRWFNRTVKQCKNCGLRCILLPEDHFADVSKMIKQKEEK